MRRMIFRQGTIRHARNGEKGAVRAATPRASNMGIDVHIFIALESERPLKIYNAITPSRRRDDETPASRISSFCGIMRNVCVAKMKSDALLQISRIRNFLLSIARKSYVRVCVRAALPSHLFEFCWKVFMRASRKRSAIPPHDTDNIFKFSRTGQITFRGGTSYGVSEDERGGRTS